MSGNPYTLFVLELCKHCGEPSPSSSQVGTHPIENEAAPTTATHLSRSFAWLLPSVWPTSAIWADKAAG